MRRLGVELFVEVRICLRKLFLGLVRVLRRLRFLRRDVPLIGLGRAVLRSLPVLLRPLLNLRVFELILNLAYEAGLEHPVKRAGTRVAVVTAPVAVTEQPS